MLAPAAQAVPASQITKRNIEACVNAAVHDCLRRHGRLAGRKQLLHYMQTIVMASTDRFDEGFLVAVPNLDPGIVLRRLCHSFAGRRGWSLAIVQARDVRWLEAAGLVLVRQRA
ncbi:hypothetical protein GCM10010869_21830 [Mesorhizobium tianshanense]|nr:hypothetical protein [Mesorhizobium tianshanense]GLS36592.1 hypothetical protein GCM10010869_21830 [Mesorhizobium tianshanense]